MTARALYNEIDRDAAIVLHALINDGVIAPGVVNTTSIKDLTANDLRGFTQVHLFAGGGLWSVAARLAGWPDDRPLWTASCPCQPFSQAGKGAGISDPRHLWPDVDRLINGARSGGFGPPVVVGEQVAGKAGTDWFNGVRADLAAQGYRSRVVDIPSCAVDAPHIRQRLYWAALADSEGEYGRSRPTGQADRKIASNPHDTMVNAAGLRRGEGQPEPEFRSGRPTPASADTPGQLGHSFQSRLEGQRRDDNGAIGRAIKDRPVAATDGSSEALGDTDRARELQRGKWGEGVQSERGRRDLHADGGDGESNMADSDVSGPGEIGCARGESGDASIGTWRRQRHELGNYHRPNGSYWSDHEWIICHDGKARRAKSGVRGMAHGYAGGMAGIGDTGADEIEDQVQKVLSPALLVHGVKARVPLWKIIGNAINPVLAAEVLASLLDAEQEVAA